MKFGDVLYQARERVTTITLNRPESHNAMRESATRRRGSEVARPRRCGFTGSVPNVTRAIRFPAVSPDEKNCLDRIAQNPEIRDSR